MHCNACLTYQSRGPSTTCLSHVVTSASASASTSAVLLQHQQRAINISGSAARQALRHHHTREGFCIMLQRTGQHDSSGWRDLGPSTRSSARATKGMVQAREHLPSTGRHQLVLQPSNITAHVCNFDHRKTSSSIAHHQLVGALYGGRGREEQVPQVQVGGDVVQPRGRHE